MVRKKRFGVRESGKSPDVREGMEGGERGGGRVGDVGGELMMRKKA